LAKAVEYISEGQHGKRLAVAALINSAFIFKLIDVSQHADLYYLQTVGVSLNDCG
jgi:hypothetical protein